MIALDCKTCEHTAVNAFELPCSECGTMRRMWKERVADMGYTAEPCVEFKVRCAKDKFIALMGFVTKNYQCVETGGRGPREGKPDQRWGVFKVAPGFESKFRDELKTLGVGESK